MKSFFLTRMALNPLGADKEVSTIAVIAKGHLLMGLRKDNGKWTLPGGHADEGETALETAVRELFEEASIMGPPMEYMASERIDNCKDGKSRIIHAFRMDLDRFPVVRTSNDPDNEIAFWDWVPMLPNHDRFKPENLHSPRNIVLRQLGLQQENPGAQI